MSTSDYKRGVEDALKELPELPSVAVAYVRKTLLIKKVTRWVNVYADGSKISVAPVTFDTEQSGKGAAAPKGVPTDIRGLPLGTYQSTVPIEIETEI